MRIGSLFSGYGGLDMGIQSVLGGDTAWFVEFDKAPSRILAHHWPDVPNYGDVTTVDWSQVEPVDIITGGFPCQDVSHAGRRAGLIRDGEGRTRSGLWGEMLRAIVETKPRLVVAENVRGLLSARADSDMEQCPFCMGDSGGSPMRALGAVLGDLADIGFDAWWYGLRAADVGAAHGRFRIFVFATPADAEPLSLGQYGDARGLAAQAAGRVQEDRDAARSGALGGRPVDRGGVTANAGPLHARSGLSESVTHLDPDGFVGGVLPLVDLDERGEVADGFGAEVDVHDSTLPAKSAADLTSSGSQFGNGSRLLPTPQARDHKDHRIEAAKHRPDDADNLNRAIAHLATDGTKGGPNQRGSSGDLMLPSAVNLLPTPRARDHIREGYEAGLRRSSPQLETTAVAGVKGDIRWGDYAAAIARWEHVIGRAAPAPTEPGKSGPRLSAAFVEFLMGLPAGHVTDPAIGISRNDQLKALGNGVVPQQAAAAVRAFVQDFEALTGATA